MDVGWGIQVSGVQFCPLYPTPARSTYVFCDYPLVWGVYKEICPVNRFSKQFEVDNLKYKTC